MTDHPGPKLQPKTLEAIRLAQEFVSVPEIADRLGMKKNTIYVLLNAARKRGTEIPKWPVGKPGMLRIEPTINDFNVLMEEAVNRKMSIQHMLTMIVHNVVQSNLFKAILDD